MISISWGEPRPLRQRTDAIPFPLDALPPVLRDMAGAISVTTSTDVGMAGTAMLSAVGYCFSGMYRLAGKTDHTEPPILYSIIIAQPSERKSPVMHFIKEPFDTFESKYNHDHREEMYKAQQDIKALEARVRAMEKENEPDTTAIAKLRVQADNICNASPIRIAVDDITPESLVIELSENDSLLMISDEAGMLSNFNGKYSGGVPNLDLFLKAWNGEKYICNRVIRGRSEIPRPYLSVAIAGQPYIWDNMMNDTAFRSSGMLARFIHCFAESDVGHRRYDTAAIPKEIKEKYHSLIHQFLKGKKDWSGEETILHLSRKASDEYISYCNNYIEQEIKQSMCCCQDWGGKFHGLILRIACILHCVDCCSRGIEPSEESVNHDTLLKAFNLAHYYRYQAIHAFSVNAPDGNIVKAEKIIQMFKTKEIKQGLKSELYHSCRCNLFPNAKDFYSALDTLAEYGYVAYEDVTAANNKKAQMVYVNPNI
ncbi:MAG: YfjI family protein [Oscillospiraceae bacterium]